MFTKAQLAGPGRAEAGPARWSAQRVGAGRSAAGRVPAAYQAAEQSSGAEEGATEGAAETMARRGGDGAARIRPESTARRGLAGCSAEGPARARTAAAAAMDVDVRERKKGGMETAKSQIPPICNTV